MKIRNVRRLIVMKRSVVVMKYYLLMEVAAHQELTCYDLMMINMVI